MLTRQERIFLLAIDRLKIWLLVLAFAVFAYVLCLPNSAIQMSTSLIGIALCCMFWLTQRLLHLISQLDYELTRLTGAVQESLTEQQRQALRS